MDEMRKLAQDPKFRRRFERMLYLAAQRGDADLVAERLTWGIDPNCASKSGRTPLVANARGFCPSAATVKALLAGGADPSVTDKTGLSALDYARRKLAKIQQRPRRPKRKSPSLDENDQLQLGPVEQQDLDETRRELGPEGREYMHLFWQERLRAARRVFNDPEQIEQIVEILEAATGQG